jgi:hypothetical protein
MSTTIIPSSASANEDETTTTSNSSNESIKSKNENDIESDESPLVLLMWCLSSSLGLLLPMRLLSIGINNVCLFDYLMQLLL